MEETYDQIHLSYRRGDLNTCLNLLEKADTKKLSKTELELARGHVLSRLKQWPEALEAYRRAYSMDPSNPYLEACFQTVLLKNVPTWHFPMLADQHRNQAYQTAIEKAVAANPTMKILDIGTGSGLLAMMAARAGAKNITACEMDSEIAQCARKIIEQNGYANSIQVISRRSTDLSILQDLGEPADLIVSEIVDMGLLGEHILPTMRHALSHLTKPSVRLIPESACIIAQLIEFPRLKRIHPFSTISGLDLNPLNQFMDNNSYKGILLESEPHHKLSGEFLGLEVDFYNPPPFASSQFPHKKKISVPIERDGECTGVAFWFELQLDREIRESSGPNGNMPCWGQAVQFFENPFEVKKGEGVEIHLHHHDTALSWSQPIKGSSL